MTVGDRTLSRPFWPVIVLMIKQIGLPLRVSSVSVNHLYDYRADLTPLSPFTITYRSIIVSTFFSRKFSNTLAY